MTREYITQHSQSERYDYPDVIHSDYGLNIDLSEYGAKAIPQWGRGLNNPKRRITLNITTYRGISSNAEHYYGEIEFQGVYVSHIDNLKRPYNGEHRNTISKKYSPAFEYSHNLKLTRDITEQDKIDDSRARCKADVKFEDYAIGDETNRFNDIDSLIAFFKEVVKQRFVGDWEYRVKYGWVSMPEIIEI